MMYQVKKMTAEIDVQSYLREFVEVERFLHDCRACPNYGARWSCPPYSFDVMDLWAHFQTLRLFCVQIEYDRAVVSQSYSKAEKGLVLQNSLVREKRQLRERLEEKGKLIPGSIVLASGCCELCRNCARKTDMPCRYPKHMHYSIESLGGDVVKTAHDVFNVNLQWMQEYRLPPYFAIVGGLLF